MLGISLMRKKRSFLKFSVFGFLIVGFIFSAYPFIASMAPSEEVRSKIKSFDISWIAVGETKKTPDVAYPANIFITRLNEDDFFIFSIPYVKREDRYWYGPPFFECNDIEVNLQANQVNCLYNEMVYVSWNMQGKPAKAPYPELNVLPYLKNGKTVRYGRGVKFGSEITQKSLLH